MISDSWPGSEVIAAGTVLVARLAVLEGLGTGTAVSGKANEGVGVATVNEPGRGAVESLVGAKVGTGEAPPADCSGEI